MPESAPTHLLAGPGRFGLQLGPRHESPADGVARRTVAVPGHLHGPTGVLQGGLAAGLLAEIARAEDRYGAPITAFEARLHAPTLLGRELTTTCRETHAAHYDVSVLDEQRTLVSGHVELAGREPAPRAGDLAALAHVPLPEPEPQPAFPQCVVCGPDNPQGLHLLPAWHAPDSVVVGFVPADDLAGADGLLHPLVTAAVLDCPGVWAGMPAARASGNPIALLAGYRVQYFADVPLWESLRTVARLDLLEGRKLSARAALVDEEGAVYALATALHVTVPAMPDIVAAGDSRS